MHVVLAFLIIYIGTYFDNRHKINGCKTKPSLCSEIMLYMFKTNR